MRERPLHKSLSLVWWQVPTLRNIREWYLYDWFCNVFDVVALFSTHSHSLLFSHLVSFRNDTGFGFLKFCHISRTQCWHTYFWKCIGTALLALSFSAIVLSLNVRGCYLFRFPRGTFPGTIMSYLYISPSVYKIQGLRLDQSLDNLEALWISTDAWIVWVQSCCILVQDRLRPRNLTAAKPLNSNQDFRKIRLFRIHIYWW